jgi:hypothetical protein
VPTIRHWLLNGWNTERLLRTNRDTLTGGALRTCIHWAFPQAYYSVYAIIMAFFHAVGHTETTHVAVLKKVGKMIRGGSYPDTLGFYADGGKTRTYSGLAATPLPSPLYFDPYDAGTVDAHLQRFLKATRDHDLKALAPKLKIRNRLGRLKKHFSDSDWDRISQALEPTTALSLLYRKRIKANYRNIDTYLCTDLDPTQVLDGLIRVIKALNATHEAFICSALTTSRYEALLATLDLREYPFVTQRTAHVTSLEA